jgi:hypothetical protein
MEQSDVDSVSAAKHHSELQLQGADASITLPTCLVAQASVVGLRNCVGARYLPQPKNRFQQHWRLSNRMVLGAGSFFDFPITLPSRAQTLLPLVSRSRAKSEKRQRSGGLNHNSSPLWLDAGGGPYREVPQCNR